MPPPADWSDVVSPAGLFLVRRVILCLANRFAFITQMFPMLDDRYRTTMTQFKCDVTGFFAVNDWAEETLSVLTRVPAYMALVLKLMPGQKVSTAFGDVLATLAMLSRIYFNKVSVATIERWRAYNRNPNDPNATRPPAEFPNGDVSKEEMRNAGRKYLSLIAA